MYFFTKTDFYSSYHWPWFFLISIMVRWWLYHKDVKLMVHQLQKVTNEWLLGSSTTRLPCMNDVTLRIKLRIITRTTEQHQQQRKTYRKVNLVSCNHVFDGSDAEYCHNRKTFFFYNEGDKSIFMLNKQFHTMKGKL